MESNWQYGGWIYDSSLMSLSIRDCTQHEQVADEIMLKSGPYIDSSIGTEIRQNMESSHRKDDLLYLRMSKGVKRKRCLKDVPELALGLCCPVNSSDSEGSSETPSLGRFPVKEAKEHFSVDLGLGLAHPFSRMTHQPLFECLASPTGLKASGDSSSVTSIDSELNMHSHGNQKHIMGLNMSLGLGSLQAGDLGCYPLFKKSSGVSDGTSGENACDVQLQLSLSGNSAVTDSDSFSGRPLVFGPVCEMHDKKTDNTLGVQNVPVIDEGSTSGRWMKSGGYISSLLIDQRFDAPTSRCNIMNQSSRAAIETVEPSTPVGVRTSIKSGNPPDRTSKTCQFPGCKKGARGSSGLCIAHGGGRRCQKQGCNKGAEGRTAYCKAHGGGRRCQSLGCTKSAEGKTDYCISHGGGRRCSSGGCTKAARGKSGLCIRHGGGKRCQKEGCTKSAEGYFGLCISHGGGRRCQFLGCGKGAQGSTMFCKAHGGGKRCMIQGCNKGAEGSTPLCKGHGGGKRCFFEGGGICTKSVHGGTQFCVAHGGGKRCAIPGCTKSARGKTDYCVRHGGGKRCKFEGCDKSAQGSTDFCKAHGGGKRCLWGQEGSPYCEEYIKEIGGKACRGPCDKFARGKTGLCAAHNVFIQDQKFHGHVTANLVLGVASRKERGQFTNGTIVQLVEPLCEGLVSESTKKRQPDAHPNDQLHDSQNLNFNNQDLGMVGKESLPYAGASHGAARAVLRAEKVTEKDCFFQFLTASQPAANLQTKWVVSDGRRNSNLSSSLDTSGYLQKASETVSRSFASCTTDATESVAEKERLLTFGSVPVSSVNPAAIVSAKETNSSFTRLVSQSHQLIPSYVQKGDPAVLYGKTQIDAGYKKPKCINGVFNISSCSLTEARVHGGRLMALIAKETGATGDFIQENTASHLKEDPFNA